MKKNKGLTTLLGVVILVAAIARGNALYICLGIVAAVWIGTLIWGNRSSMKRFFAKLKAKHTAKKAVPVASVSSTEKTDSQVQTVLPERALIRHINYRITDKLRSSYSEAFWEWDEKPTVSFITEGGRRRIKLCNAGEYNFAEVTLDKFSNISLDLLKVVPCVQAEPDKVVSDYPVDVEAWYTTRAQEVLEDVIGELNTHGINCLEIDVNGEIVTQEGEKRVTHGKLENMPAESYFKSFAQMLTDKFELQASVDNEIVKVSW